MTCGLTLQEDRDTTEDSEIVLTKHTTDNLFNETCGCVYKREFAYHSSVPTELRMQTIT
jgi:hypothetical protein